METITARYTWRCPRCGKSKESQSSKFLEQTERDHTCNPVLYDIILKLPFKKDMTYKGKPQNNNGNVDLVAGALGITKNLAGLILNEMQVKGLVHMATPLD